MGCNKLLQTPSKISILALLMNSSANRESLMRVLDQALVKRDVSLDQYNGVAGNITSCNNLSFFMSNCLKKGETITWLCIYL